MSGHPFRLVNPPEGQAQIIEAAIAAIDYPWHRLADAVAADPDKAVVVEWDDTGQGTSGLYLGGSAMRIVLGTRPYHLDAGAGFVFAHEVGHLVDDATFDAEKHAALTDLCHQTPGQVRRATDERRRTRVFAQPAALRTMGLGQQVPVPAQ